MRLIPFLVVAVLVTGCAEDAPAVDTVPTQQVPEPATEPVTEPPTEPPTQPATQPATEPGGCTATGEITGAFEASFVDAAAYGSFLGDEGAYGVTVADGVSLDIFVLASGTATMSLTGDGVIFGNQGEGLTFADGGAGASIDADLAQSAALGGGSAHVTAEVTCS